MKKICDSLRKHSVELTNFKNEVINKWAAEIIWECKYLLDL